VLGGGGEGDRYPCKTVSLLISFVTDEIRILSYFEQGCGFNMSKVQSIVVDKCPSPTLVVFCNTILTHPIESYRNKVSFLRNEGKTINTLMVSKV
jgi:hypothetical protein